MTPLSESTRDLTIPGLLFVISAPSGAGKRTVLDQVRRRDPSLRYSVSATTRPKRADEVEGEDYYFLDRPEFERGLAAGEFVEWAEVHGNLYGTLRSELERCSENGQDIVLELDVQGMRNLRASKLPSISIFIMAPSHEELEARLKGRATEPPDVIALRMKNAADEMAARHEFDHVLTNDRVEDTVAGLENIIQRERLRARPAK